MKHAPLVLVALLAGFSCKTPVPEPGPEPAPPPDEVPIEEGEPPRTIGTGGPKTETGGCKNEHINGTCSFILMSAEKDSGPPEGTTVYKVMYSVEEGEKKVELDRLCLRIATDREEDLREFLEKSSPVDCTAYIVRPPCNPQATSVTPKLEMPDWVTRARCY